MDEALWNAEMTGRVFEVAKVCITALAGFAGVWYGQRKSAQRDAKQEQLDRALATVLVTQELERFVAGCVAVGWDDGTKFGQPSGSDGHCRATTDLPKFNPETIDIRWQALPVLLMAEVLSIPRTLESIDRILSDDDRFYDPPEYGEFFWTRRHEFAKLGIQVVRLIRALKVEGGLLKDRHAPLADQSLGDHLNRIIAECEAHWALIERVNLESYREMRSEA